MSIAENRPILTIEDAKRYFKAMGCSHFHLEREDFQRRDEYRALHISREMELKWRQEEIEREFPEFPFDDTEKSWMYFDSLASKIEMNRNDCNRLLALTENLYHRLPNEHITHILRRIVGNNATITHGGLIERCHYAGLRDVAQSFVNIAKKFIEKAETNHVTLFFNRGYFCDVVQALNMKEDTAYLQSLREKDDRASFQYYKKGAEEENVYSMRMLASCYRDGKGCETDRKKALFWMEKADEK